LKGIEISVDALMVTITVELHMMTVFNVRNVQIYVILAINQQDFV